MSPSSPALATVRPPPWTSDGALIAYGLALVYASLYPFIGWRLPEAGLLAWPRYGTLFDVALNFLAYCPLGTLLATSIRRRDGSAPPAGRLPMLRIGVMATIAGAVLSLVLESMQCFLPGRVSSLPDLLANTAGTAAGALAALNPAGRLLLARVRRWRQQRFVSGMVGHWGLLLLALWFFAQLNPAIPFFEAGNFINPLAPVERPNPYDMPVLAPQAIGIALNVSGFALFASLLLDPHRRAMVSILMLLALGFVAKVTMASLMLKAPQLIAWLGPATVIGLAAGVLLFLPLQALSYRWRAFGATLFVFGGGLLSKLNSVYGAFDEMLRLFDWPHGHLVNFASLTRWVHEVWPLAVCLFLSLVFLMPRMGSRMPADQSMKSPA